MELWQMDFQTGLIICWDEQANNKMQNWLEKTAVLCNKVQGLHVVET